MDETSNLEDFGVYEFTKDEQAALKDKAEKIKKTYKVKAVYCISVKGEEGDDKEEYVGWLKRPDLTVMSAFSSLAQKDPIKAIQMVVNSCWLEGDAEIKTDDDIFLGAMTQVQEMMNVRQSRILKL